METGPIVPGYSGGLAAWMVVSDLEPCFEGCGLGAKCVETGADVPGYSGGFAAWMVVSDSDLL